MTAEAGSTVPRRQLGRYLRQLREDAQITVKGAAEALEWSAPKIWRIEGGATSMRTLDVEAMCRVYGAPTEMTEALMGLAKETKARGWWHSYGDAIPAWFELYVGLEAAANRLCRYESDLIPGLLQTQDYATAVLQVGDFPPADVERSVAVRLGRQALITRRVPTAPQIDFILNEATLRRSPGDRVAMTHQLQHLNEVGKLPNVSIKVIPFDAGIHLGMTSGAFTLLDYAQHGTREPEPSVVYSGNLTGALYLDKPQEVAAYRTVWTNLQTAALTEAQSKKLISATAEEYATP